MNEWQPIETAPKNAVEILVFTDSYEIRICYGHRYADEFEWAEYGSGQALNPIYWMKLPEPPL